ncbi:ATP-binding protein [Streptomyces scopuliridis]|uniref:ATP-binding protein n=1 Tax=Streptomyces scopuliridis TaxID=452529 RepID=UPI00368D0E9C
MSDLFVGRDRELADLPELLWRRRLVSLVGPAGVGKTRLAAETAHRVRAAYPGGVWWVDLSSIRRGWLIGPAVSGAVGQGNAGRDVKQVVADAVEAGAFLLVMDNCEHLLDDAAAIITELRGAAPQMRILTTSREALHAPGESIMPLWPLPSTKGYGKAARGADAVRLFAARAGDVQPGFDTDAWVGVITDICDRLDGLPLAIEFAARQSDIFTPAQLLPRLAERLVFLTERGTQDLHASLRSAIQWSYDLLSETAKAVFARLCILPGGFDEHTAAALTDDLELTREKLWKLLTDLVRKSMVAIHPSQSGRFRILESLRAFGQEALTNSKQLEATQIRLADWLVSYEHRLAENPWGDQLTALVNQMAIELDNVRYGLDAMAKLDHPHHATLVLLLSRLLTIGPELSEANRLLGEVVTSPDATAVDRASAGAMMAINAGRLGDPEGALRLAHDAADLAQPLNDLDVVTAAQTSVMVALGLNYDVAGGLMVGAGLIDRLRLTNRPGALGRVLNLQAWLLSASGDIDGAYQAITEAISIHEALADQTAPMSVRFANEWATGMLQTGAQLAILRGDDVTATEYMTTILTTRIYHHNAVVGALACAAVLAAREGDNERALLLAAGAIRWGHQNDYFRDTQLEAVIRTARHAVGSAKAQIATKLGRTLTISQLKIYTLTNALPASNEQHEVLTAREHQVALQVARGLTNAQIAMRLAISQRTVASHLARIRSKLDLNSRVEVALWTELTRPGKRDEQA